MNQKSISHSCKRRASHVRHPLFNTMSIPHSRLPQVALFRVMLHGTGSRIPALAGVRGNLAQGCFAATTVVRPAAAIGRYRCKAAPQGIGIGLPQPLNLLASNRHHRAFGKHLDLHHREYDVVRV